MSAADLPARQAAGGVSHKQKSLSNWFGSAGWDLVQSVPYPAAKHTTIPGLDGLGCVEIGVVIGEGGRQVFPLVMSR